MSLDPNKTYLEWNGTTFPSSTDAKFKAPAGSTIDWGDGTIETFETASTVVNTHTYTDGLESHIIIIGGLTSIGTWAFAGCSNLNSINIQDGLMSIGDWAFGSCTSLTSIEIPSSVTSIGYSAFWGCISLTNIVIPSSVTTIGISTFARCTSLTNITIPDSVTSMNSFAFERCDNLKTIILFPETPPTLGSTNAIPTTISTIYVQQSSKEAYKTATNWTAFADKIESNNIYLSLIRFNKKNKEYIDGKAKEVEKYVDKESTNLRLELDKKLNITDIEAITEEEISDMITEVLN